MTVKIGMSEYELEYGFYSSKEPYNFVAGNIGASIDEIDKTIIVHAFDLEAYKTQIDVVQEAIWFELFCAYVYERYKIELWKDGSIDGDAYAILRTMAGYMDELQDAYYDIKTDMYHYISVEEAKEKKR